MQAIDTNLLVRLFVADDPEQADKVKALFDRHADEEGAFWVADIVPVAAGEDSAVYPASTVRNTERKSGARPATNGAQSDRR